MPSGTIFFPRKVVTKQTGFCWLFLQHHSFLFSRATRLFLEKQSTANHGRLRAITCAAYALKSISNWRMKVDAGFHLCCIHIFWRTSQIALKKDICQTYKIHVWSVIVSAWLRSMVTFLRGGWVQVRQTCFLAAEFKGSSKLCMRNLNCTANQFSSC